MSSFDRSAFWPRHDPAFLIRHFDVFQVLQNLESASLLTLVRAGVNGFVNDGFRPSGVAL